MQVSRFVGWREAYGLAAVVAALAACGGSDAGNLGASGDAGPDATSGPGTHSDAGSGPADATIAGDASGGDAGSSDASAEGSDGGSDARGGDDSGATEPAYLRNDALAGFAWTADYGSPYDSILAAPLNTTQSAIAAGYGTETPPSQIVDRETFKLVANSSDIYNALQISASLSVSTGLASVNTKTAWAQSQQIDTTDLTVLVDLTQVGPAQKIVNPSLTAAAAALTPEQFYALYGDRYAAEIVTGAEMFCLVDIKTFSQEDKSSLTTSLGFSYGTSSASATFATQASTALANHQTNVSCQYLGYAPKTVISTLPSLLDAANAFQEGEAQNLGDVGTSTLYLLYTSYYGIAGYPGVPAGTADRVTQQAQAAADFLLYDSLVNRDFAAYYGDPAYASLPFFADMKAFDTASSQYLTAALANSQNPGMAVPTVAADALLSNWLTTPSVASAAGATPAFQTYVLANGIVPKKLVDYDIPLRYAYPDAAGNGRLDGQLYTPVQPVPPAAQLAANSPAVDYPLYLLNRAGTGGGLALEYLWDTGNYFLGGVTGTDGKPDLGLVTAALSGFQLAGNLGTEYVVVNTANGLVVTDMGTGNAMQATHFTSGNARQLWDLYLDNGSGNCATYTPPPGTGNPGNCTVDGNYPGTTCGTGLYAISAYDLAHPASGYWDMGSNTVGTPVKAGGPGGCGHCNSSCNGGVYCENSSNGGGPDPSDLFFLQAWNAGTTHAIYDVGLAWMATDPTTTSYNLNVTALGDANAPDGGVVEEPVVVGGNTGQANELWVFIPEGNVDNSP